MTPAHPVFVGGSGRSGTTIVGSLIAHHPRFAGVPFELKVHLMTGYVARGARTGDWMREETWKRYPTHLHRILGEDTLRELLECFLEAGPGQSPATAQAFIEGLMGPVALRAGKPSWVEMTPLNAMMTTWLHGAFPEMRLIHMLRDGRDVAMSTSVSWGQMTPFEALDWWGMRIEQIARDTAQCPEGTTLTLRFEALVRDAREPTYARLLEFLGIEDAPSMRKFFERRLRADHANIGRWQAGLPAAEQADFTARYQEILERLQDQGVDWIPSPNTVP